MPTSLVLLIAAACGIVVANLHYSQPLIGEISESLDLTAGSGAEQGGYSVLTFRVPTESETAGTVKLTVQLPSLKSARTEPMPGWTATIDRNADQATAVTWTADAGTLVGPDQFEQFELAAGPLPNQDTVSFPAAQTYSDGTVVNWEQPTPAGGSEPEYPAPTLTLAAASGSETGSEHGEFAHTSETTSTGTSDTLARWLGGIGLVLGAVGALAGIAAFARSRRS
ncbi:YcnI family protein [Rhodococcus wratislaviensis]|nr:YcnI family protein [Rhodococcus sp. 3A]MBC2897487.1 YcnI family protein [Rhodococcus sp. 4CII]